MGQVSCMAQGAKEPLVLDSDRPDAGDAVIAEEALRQVEGEKKI